MHDSSPLSGLCSLWIEKIRHAAEHKKKVFGNDADEAMRFYKPEDGTYGFLYRGDRDGRFGVGLDVPEPTFRMTYNKVAELVQIYGPILYHKNPIRQVNPRATVALPLDVLATPALMPLFTSGLPPEMMQDPQQGQVVSQMVMQSMAQQEQAAVQVDGVKSKLMEEYLNFTPNELNLKFHSRQAVDEALIKGRGVLVTATYTPPNSPTKFVGSFFDSVDNLYVDPDAEDFDDAWWIARKVVEPIWECERKHGLEPGTLRRRGNAESSALGVEVDLHGKYDDRRKGLTNDLIVYYEIYSRMGVGGRLSGGSKGQMNEAGLVPGDLDEFSEILDPIVGDFVYLCVAPNVDWPLNLPPEITDLPLEPDPLTGEPPAGPAVIRQKLAWPIPFWADGLWPVSVLDFHAIPRSAWPMSHIKPALGELRALNWLYSFMIGKAQVTLRTLVAVLKEMSEEFKVQVLEGADLTMVELDAQNRSIQECVQVLQYPQMNADMWRIIQAIEASFEKRVGLNEVFYGTSETAMRSATEADMKSRHLNIRPDDMAEVVETWMTQVARKEAMAARLLLSPQDIQPILGPTAALLWAQLLTAQDPVVVARELDYRIEAGSSRKPNRDRDIQNSNDSMQTMLPILSQFAASTGQLGPLNALFTFWAKVRDLDPTPFLLAPPPPPPMLPAPPGGAEGHGATPGGPPAEGGPTR